MKRTEISHRFMVEEEKGRLTLMKAWDYSNRLGEEDKLLVKMKKRNLVINKEDLQKRIEHASLKEKWDVYKELKAKLYGFASWG